MSLSWRCAFLLVISFCLVALSFTTGRQSRAALTASASPELLTPQKTVVAGFDFANLDRGASACQDFNRFANGGWMDKNPIPAAYSRWGRFEMLDEQNINVLHTILDDLLAKKNSANSNEEKIASFYGSCMDEQKIEAQGIA